MSILWRKTKTRIDRTQSEFCRSKILLQETSQKLSSDLTFNPIVHIIYTNSKIISFPAIQNLYVNNLHTKLKSFVTSKQNF